MKSRLISTFLALCLLFAAIPTVNAAEFSDIANHWAQEYIEQAVESGLFHGISETEFAPEGTMTRAMFVTVLGRFEGIDEEYWSSEGMPQFFKQDMDNDAYYAPYVRWAVCNGIVNGMNDFLFAPNAPITREQMAKVIAYYVEKMGHELLPAEQAAIPEGFADANKIAAWALPSVEALRESGILNGSANKDGTYSFLPQDTATRAEGAAVFCRLMKQVVKSEAPSVLPQQLYLEASEVTLKEGESRQLIAISLPVTSSLVWRSSDRSIVSVDEGGLISYVGEGVTTVNAYTPNGLYATCTVTCEADKVFPSADYTKSEKCDFVFGEYVKDPRLYYNNQAAAKADMVMVTVYTWDINSNGEKYTRSWQLEVHKNLADTVKAIFEEIYNGEEQFPIHTLGGFRWATKSEHSIGCAIDINYDENYYCDPNGNALVGSFWKPGENPYSIKPDGDVVKAFEKYGFVWGVNWNSGYKDYMHFSFYGT